MPHVVLGLLLAVGLRGCLRLVGSFAALGVLLCALHYRSAAYHPRRSSVGLPW